MKQLSFSKIDTAFVSEAFSGGVVIQVANSTGRARVGIETCINPDMGWCNSQSVMLEGSTAVISIKEYGKDQLFRLRSSVQISAVTTDIATSSGASSEAVAALSSRVAELEDGQEPLVLSVNEDGDLTQEGVSSGTFGVNDDGDLTFTSKE